MQKYFAIVFFIGLCYGSSLGFEEDVLGLPVLDYDDTNNYDVFWDAQYNLLRQEKSQEQKRTDQILKQLCENNDFTLKDILIDCENIKITPKSEKSVIKKRDVTEVLEEGSGDDAPEDPQENKETGSLTEQSISVKSAQVETAPGDSAPVKPAPEESIKENPAPPESTSVDSAPIEEAEEKAQPVKAALEESAAIEAIPVKASPIEAAPIKATPVKESPVEAARVEVATVEVAPVEAAPVEASPIKATPVKESPVEAASVETAPVTAAPVEAAPVDAVDAAPVEAAPVKAVPVEATPVEATPVEAAPVDAVDAAPVKAAPVKAVPVEAAPVEAAPVEAASVEAAPIEAAPVEAAPIKATPVKESPVEAAPVDAAPADIVPAEPVKLDSTPLGSVPAKPAPGETAVKDFESSVAPDKSAPELSKTTGQVPEAATVAIESVKETTKLLNKEENEILEKDDMSSGSNLEENDEKNKGSKDKKGRKLTQEYINDEQSGVAVYKVDAGITETEAKLIKMNTNESIKTASIGGVGESTEANASGNDNKILITLFVGVLAVGVAAFSYNYIKKKKRNNDPSSRTKNGVIQSDPEDGAEMKPLVRENSPNVEYKNEKKENAST